MEVEEFYVVEYINEDLKEESKDKKNFTPSNLRKLYGFNFLMGFYMISGVIIPFYLTYGRLTFFEFTILQALYALMVFLFEIPCGGLADRRNRKYILFFSGVTSAIGALIYGTIPNFFVFLLGDAFFALGTALMSGTNEAMTYDTIKSSGKTMNFSKSFAKVEAFFLIGIVISAPLGTVIALYLSLPMVMTFMFFPYIISGFVALTLKEPKKIKNNKKGAFTQTIKSGFRSLKSNRILRKLIIDMLVIEMLIMVLSVTYQLYLLSKFDTPIVYLGFISSGLTLSQVIFLNLIPKAEGVTRDKKIIHGVSTIVPGILFIVIAIITLEPVIIIFTILILGIGTSRYVLYFNGINEQIKEENRATILSTINTIRVLLKSLILPLIGLIAIINLQGIFVFVGIVLIFIAMFSKVRTEEL